MTIKMGIAVLLAGVAVLNVNGVFAVDKFTEEELTELEYKNGTGNFEIMRKERVLARFPVLAYVEAFNAEEKYVATLEQKKDVDLMKGVETSAAIATSPVFVAGGVNSTTGAIGNAATVIAAAGIGLNILNAIFSTDVERKARFEQLYNMKSPSFYLVRIDPETKGDEDLIAIQRKANGLALVLPFDCKVTANILGEKGAGAANKNHFYMRNIMCADDRTERTSLFERRPEYRNVTSIRYDQFQDPNGSVSIIGLYAIDKMKYTKMLGIPEADDDQKALLGKIAYERAKDVIPPDWTAVYTAPNTKGEWTVFVARSGVTIELPMPKS